MPLPEVTVLKLFRDMSLALGWIHNSLRTTYVHGNIKPDNILVSAPQGHDSDNISLEPVFKLADFARLAPYPTPDGAPESRFHGTVAYAPSTAEQKCELHPSADIWMVALQFDPREGKFAYLKRLAKTGRDLHPNDKPARMVMYRPLHTTAADLCRNALLDLEWQANLHSHKPYSSLLNLWYKQMFDTNPKRRISAAHLVKYAVPMIDRQLHIARRLAAADACFEKAARLWEQVKLSQEARGQDEFTVQSKLRVVEYGRGWSGCADGEHVMNG